MKSKYILISVIIVFVMVSGILYGSWEHETGEEFVLEYVNDADSLENSGPSLAISDSLSSDLMNKDSNGTIGQDENPGSQSLIIRGRVFVHIHGAVVSEGVYELNSGSRVYQALEMAGGLTSEGSSKTVNQARVLVDGESIYFPTKEEESVMVLAAEEAEANDPRIDINKASKSELMDLPGIGDTKARSIIAYRQLNGSFKQTEEIMGVSGIKESLYESIKDLIKVSN